VRLLWLSTTQFHVRRSGAFQTRAPAPGSYTAAGVSPACPRGSTIGYIGLLVAIVAGVLHAALAPVLVIAGVKPNLVLVGVVLVAATSDLLPATLWAFVAGLTANLIVPEPLGSIPLIMLLVAAPIALLRRATDSWRWLYPIAAALAGSIVADLFALLIFSLVAGPAQTAIPIHVVGVAAVVNAIITAVLLVPLRLWILRREAETGTAW
jgi:cell shape-determining protein MreD